MIKKLIRNFYKMQSRKLFASLLCLEYVINYINMIMTHDYTKYTYVYV